MSHQPTCRPVILGVGRVQSALLPLHVMKSISLISVSPIEFDIFQTAKVDSASTYSPAPVASGMWGPRGANLEYASRNTFPASATGFLKPLSFSTSLTPNTPREILPVLFLRPSEKLLALIWTCTGSFYNVNPSGFLD